MNTTPPTACPAWRKLEAHAESWRSVQLAELFAGDPARAATFGAQAPGLRLDFSRQRVGRLTLALLAQLLAERGFDAWRRALFAGEKVNLTEARAASHPAQRAATSGTPARMTTLAAKIRAERKIRRVVNLGTGGSDLGPRLLADAFGDGTFDVRFAANVDPLDLERALAGADPAATLLVVVSKTFTTAETLANAAAARARGFGNILAVTANAAAAQNFGAREILPMPDSVGGRYSIWSAAGFSGMLAIGEAAFAEFLAGGCDLDAHFLAEPAERNLPVLLALLGAWNVNFLDARVHAVLPYAHRLRLLPAYLQQLEMESNGKSIDHAGGSAAYATAPVLFGGEGTPSQHSFHQLLHQGTQLVPADFIVAGVDAALDANAEAQAQALAFGSTDASLPSYRRHAGNRPSNTLRLERLDPRHLGRLIALYEHKVFTQGVLWNIDSFDQWGVELGKQLAHRILKGEM
jgi:glucose-6-phosphate isomerase